MHLLQDRRPVPARHSAGEAMDGQVRSLSFEGDVTKACSSDLRERHRVLVGHQNRMRYGMLEDALGGASEDQPA